MKICILSLGCKVNLSEMDGLGGLLEGRGHELVSLEAGPGLCVINTCTVTSKSDYQSRQLIRRAERAGARAIVTGCYSELNATAVGRMPGVQRVVLNADKDSLIKFIDAQAANDAPVCSTEGRARHFLKVQDGCDNACTYCLVTIARGPSSSLLPDKVVNQVKKAIEAGYSEVVLTGVHLGTYGNGPDSGVTLSSLVQRVLSETGIERLRLSSLEITEVDDTLIRLMQQSCRIAPHLHVPLQSGSDRVLGAMNRGYGAERFASGIREIALALPGIGLGTDVIAGYPDETDDEHLESMELLSELPFTYMHVFPYSARPGTLAAALKDTVGDVRRKERASALRALGQRKKSVYMNAQVGETLYMLVERRVGQDLYQGTTCNYLKARAHLRGDALKSIVPVTIEGLDNEILRAVHVS